MCGIIAAASNRNVSELLVEGLHKMEYRGYDSAGLALHRENNIAHIRTLGKVSLLEEKLKLEELNSTLGIAHTRWATHGEPSEKNAHPHSSKNNIYVVHNGIIENHIALKETLKKEASKYLEIFRDHPYIFNLGHGILPETNPEMVENLIKIVKDFK